MTWEVKGSEKVETVCVYGSLTRRSWEVRTRVGRQRGMWGKKGRLHFGRWKPWAHVSVDSREWARLKIHQRFSHPGQYPVKWEMWAVLSFCKVTEGGLQIREPSQANWWWEGVHAEVENLETESIKTVHAQSPQIPKFEDYCLKSCNTVSIQPLDFPGPRDYHDLSDDWS